ncbi:MAG: Holliday junction resolvase RuvX [Lachnospiraceae bacterium]|nr:Holliday junction resolvase RuvX [Lachnospiraceae bacterium]
MRILGLDFGSKTVGVAISDPTGMIAGGVEIIRRKDETHLRKTMRRIEELIAEYHADAIVLGYPLNMDETKGERAEKTLLFKQMLEQRTGLPVHLCDERLTTVEAEEIMAATGIKRADYKKHVDRIAAAVILQDWLDSYADSDIYRS